MGEISAELIEEMYRTAYRHFSLRLSPILGRQKTSDFWVNLPHTRIARRTFPPQKEKRGLRRVVEADSVILADERMNYWIEEQRP
ncbi:MAG: hypothetical protein KDD78_16875 [Caldilineaceae bacterium]|nr:hypothetical protein [Caldilineaceae bacterium]